MDMYPVPPTHFHSTMRSTYHVTPCPGAHLHLRGRAGVGAALVADHAEDGHHYDGAATVHQ